jgi:hypothetical protein
VVVAEVELMLRRLLHIPPDKNLMCMQVSVELLEQPVAAMAPSEETHT